MDLAANHVGYVVAAFAISGLTLLALTLWVIRTDRKLRRQIEEITE